MRKMLSKLTPNATEKPLPMQLAPGSIAHHHGCGHSNKSFILVTGRCANGNQTFVTDIQANFSYQNALSRGCPELIATDGFDYLYTGSNSDVDIFSGIIEDILRRKRANQSVSGVIIIYPLGDRYYSGALQRNLKCIADLFLGKNNLDRLTILVTNTHTGRDANQTISRMCADSRRAPVYEELRNRGAQIAALDRDAIKHVERYFSKASISPPVYQIEDSQERIRACVEDTLGYYLKNSVDALTSIELASQNKSTEALTKLDEEIACYKAEIEEYRVKQLQLDAHRQKMEEEIVCYQNEHERLTQLYADLLQKNQLMVDQRAHGQEIGISLLTQRLRQTEAEYASLRSQVQLHDNYEQGKIYQDLENINSMIEHLGQSMSDDLFDRYVKPKFGKSCDNVTTLDAHDLPALKRAFGHRKGSPSLVVSANDTGLGIENFIQFSIRAQVCHLLAEKLFRPFHPFINTVESSQYAKTYEQVQRNEPQYTAGRWRSITFKNLSVLNEPAPERIGRLASQMFSEVVEPLIKYLFGLPTGQLGIQEFDECRASLKEIIAMAWEWTSRVKGEVIMLGDFWPTALDVLAGSTRFDYRIMQDFEPNVQNPHPRIALCTLGLGLDSYQARGGGELPERTIVSKITVLTDDYYEDA